VRMRGQFIILATGRKIRGESMVNPVPRARLEQDEAVPDSDGDGFGAR
jgi:hypothetical protein